MQSSKMLWIAATLTALGAASLLARADDKNDKKDPPSIDSVQGKSIEEWVRETTNEDPSVREKAIRAIMLFGPKATTALPAIVNRCGDLESSPRCRAVIALGLLEIPEPERAKVVDALAKRLEGHVVEGGRMVYDDPQGIVRYHAAVSLSRFGPDEAKSAIPQLVMATKDMSNFEIRRVAILALRKIGRDPKEGPDKRVTDALLNRLNSSTTETAAAVKLEAIISLGVMGRPADKTVLNSVEQTLKAHANPNSRDKCLVIWAEYGLMAHDSVTDAHLDAIAKYATSRDVLTRVHTAQALGAAGSKARTHVKVLIQMLQDKDGDVFMAACLALASMGDPGESAIKNLKDIAESEDENRKGYAQLALDGIANYEKNKDATDKKDDKKDAKKDK